MSHDDTLTPEEQAMFAEAAERFERGDFDDALRDASATALRGDDAKRSGQEFLARVSAGRPNLGAGTATGRGRSPRRQVRLDEDTNDWLDRYVEQHRLTPSEVIRRALVAFRDTTAA